MLPMSCSDSLSTKLSESQWLRPDPVRSLSSPLAAALSDAAVELGTAVSSACDPVLNARHTDHSNGKPKHEELFEVKEDGPLFRFIWLFCTHCRKLTRKYSGPCVITCMKRSAVAYGVEIACISKHVNSMCIVGQVSVGTAMGCGGCTPPPVALCKLKSCGAMTDCKLYYVQVERMPSE